MKKILLLAFTISFIPLETQAEQKICMQLIMDVITMEEVGTMSNCLAGDILVAHSPREKEEIQDGIFSMIAICKKGTLEILRETEASARASLWAKDFVATCEILPIKKWLDYRGYDHLE